MEDRINRLKELESENGEILLSVAVVLGTLIPAIILASIVNIGDSLAGHVALYGGAVMAGITIWRQVIKPLTKAVDIILGLDDRVERIETHLGLESINNNQAKKSVKQENVEIPDIPPSDPSHPADSPVNNPSKPFD